MLLVNIPASHEGLGRNSVACSSLELWWPTPAQLAYHDELGQGRRGVSVDWGGNRLLPHNSSRRPSPFVQPLHVVPVRDMKRSFHWGSGEHAWASGELLNVS